MKSNGSTQCRLKSSTGKNSIVSFWASVFCISYICSMAGLCQFESSVSSLRSNHCNQILLQNVEVTQFDDARFISYLQKIDSSTWNQKKTDAGFLAKVATYIPFSGELNFSEFKEKLSKYNKEINYLDDQATAYSLTRQYLTEAQINAWIKCMQTTGMGVFVDMRHVTETHITLSVFWFPPPGAPTQAPAEGVVVGGRVVGDGIAENQLFKPDTILQANSETSIVIKRDAVTPVSVAVNVAGMSGSFSYHSTFTRRMEELEVEVGNLRAKNDILEQRIARIEGALTPVHPYPPHRKDPAKLHMTLERSWDDGTLDAQIPRGYFIKRLRYGINKGGPRGIVNGIELYLEPILPVDFERESK